MLVEDKSAHWGEELHKAGWRARLIRGAYQHACNYLDPVDPKPGKYISAYNILGAKRGPCVLWFKLPIRISYRISERR
jgi:hypothetical protein